MKGTHIDFGPDHYLVVRETHEEVTKTLLDIALDGPEDAFIAFTRPSGLKVTVALSHVRAFGEIEIPDEAGKSAAGAGAEIDPHLEEVLRGG